MANQRVPQPVPTRHEVKSWFEAYKIFVTAPGENARIKILPLIALGIVPMSILDDVFVPVLGTFDNIPTFLFVLVTIWLTWRQVRYYR